MAAPYTNIRFSDAAMPRIAQAAGYSATPYNKEGFQQFLAQNPDAKAKYEQFQQQAVGTMMAARGGVVRFVDGGMVRKYAEGGSTIYTGAAIDPAVIDPNKTFTTTQEDVLGPQNSTIDSATDDSPVVPKDGSTNKPDLGDLERARLEGETPEKAQVTAEQIKQTTEQDIAKGTGEVTGDVAVAPSQTGVVTTADQPDKIGASKVEAQAASPEVQKAVDANVAEQSNFDTAIVAEEANESSVSKLDAAQGTAALIDSPAVRKIQDGELIDSVANAETASKYTEQIQAATASPTDKATVSGQLEELYNDFEGGDTPPWAAGAMRMANAAMAARGLSASSLAGQAAVQAAMEAALPIAQADASVFAQFEAQNLSNRQQRAMLAAQQRAQFIGQEFDQAFQARVANAARIADVANMNFNAEQQVILENSRAANTMNLANLNNRQAVVMAEAAALSQLDMANLNNRQQAAVQNAQNFLQVDMANLSARQQTAMFNAQSRVQSILTDTAAENAARQFNATSENQTNQFFASLSTQVSQFNSAQANAMEQFNIGQTNAVNQFNTNLQNQREQFNAANQLAISQSNATWRRQIATADTAAINRANEFNATAALGVSNTAYNNIQQFYRDVMFKAIQSQENALDRETRIATAVLSSKTAVETANINADASGDSVINQFINKAAEKGAEALFDWAFG